MAIVTGKRQSLVEAALNFPSVASQDSEALTVTVPHAQLADGVVVTPPASINGIASAGTLTMDSQPNDGDTFTLDTKVYTFEDTLTNVDGNIFTGADLAAAKVNTVAALNLGSGAGTSYALAMTAGTVTAAPAFVSDDLVVQYLYVGTAGDAIDTTETFTDGTAAQGTLTITDHVNLNSETFTVDTKTYTFEDSLTNVDGNIYTGGSEAQTKLNAVAAFDLSGVAGTDYALAMTAHTTVDCAAFAGDDAVMTAKVTGTAANSYDFTETLTDGSMDGSTTFGGTVAGVDGTNVFDAATLGTTTAGAAGSALHADGFVTGTGEVTVRVQNPSAAATDPVSDTFTVLVWHR